MVRTIVGANWGDEGKGKVTDLLAEESDVVVRFQGGANAGHTIINEYGKFALHLLPSGVFHQNVVNVIGPGVALNIEALLSELESLTSRGVKSYDELPENCRKYVEFIENACGVPIKMVSNGPKRHEVLYR